MYLNNKEMNGLASGMTQDAPGAIGAGTGSTPTTDCPCDCQDGTVEETWYINDTETPGSIPFNLTEKKVDCTPPTSKGVYDPKCPDIVAALKTQYSGNIQGIHGLGCGCGCGNSTNGFSGLGMTTDENATGGGTNPTPTPTPATTTDSIMQKAGGILLLLATLGTAMAKAIYGKKGKSK